jgi:hypothetical protein
MNLLRKGGYRSVHAGQQELSHNIRGMLAMGGVAVTVRKDDAPAAVQAAIANVVGLGWSSGGGGLIQTTSG